MVKKNRVGKKKSRPDSENNISKQKTGDQKSRPDSENNISKQKTGDQKSRPDSEKSGEQKPRLKFARRKKSIPNLKSSRQEVGKQEQPRQFASKKETRQLIILIFALVACTGVIYSLYESQEFSAIQKNWSHLRPPIPTTTNHVVTSGPNTQSPISELNTQPTASGPNTQSPISEPNTQSPASEPNTQPTASGPNTVAFVEQPEIFAHTQDDFFLELEEFFYLIHQMRATPYPKLLEKIDHQLGWQQLFDLSKRGEMRGKIMQLRGSILDLQRKELKGEFATARNLSGWYWQAVVCNADGYCYLVMLTEFPEGILPKDQIEVVGAFYKVWQYKNDKGQWAKTAVFVGNQLKKKVLEQPKGPYQISLTTACFFGMIAFIIAIAVGLDYYKSRNLFNRKKKKLSQSE